MDTTLIIASNPNPGSLTASAAKFAHTQLQRNNILCSYYYLDECAYNPILPHEEVLRRASFDTRTIEFQQAVKQSTQLALYYPDWWGMPPALLVGWIQRVFAPGIAFEHRGEEFMPKTRVPLLTHLKVLLAITSDENNKTAIVQSARILIDRLFTPMGIMRVHPHILYDTRNSAYAARRAWIKEGSRMLGG